MISWLRFLPFTRSMEWFSWMYIAMKPLLNQSQQHNDTVTCQRYIQYSIEFDRTIFEWNVGHREHNQKYWWQLPSHFYWNSFYSRFFSIVIRCSVALLTTICSRSIQLCVPITANKFALDWFNVQIHSYEQSVQAIEHCVAVTIL